MLGIDFPRTQLLCHNYGHVIEMDIDFSICIHNANSMKIVGIKLNMKIDLAMHIYNARRKHQA